MKKTTNDIFEVEIGTQIWCTRNLDVSNYRNGDAIPEIQNAEEWKYTITGAWCHYENKTANGVVYGKLYNWYAITDARGLAPLGYHIPNYIECQVLLDFLELGTKLLTEPALKIKSAKGWKENGNNSTLFSALPGGYRDDTSIFRDKGHNAYFWSYDETYPSKFYLMGSVLGSFFNDLNYNAKANAYSVRCIKD